ncbi:MAG: DUF4349 domain-containing protein [Bacteroidota bacterium]
MYTKYILFVLLASQLLFFACEAGEASPYPQNSDPTTGSSTHQQVLAQEVPDPAVPSTLLDESEMVEPVLIRTANCRMEVENIESEIDQVEHLLTPRQGYIANLTWRNSTQQREATLTLRVPAQHFSWTLDTLTKLGKVIDSQDINTQDVTEEYVDIQNRLDTKKVVRDRYEAILRGRAKTIDEILQTEKQLLQIQEEIEAKEGRLRYLSQRAVMSTITLELYEKVEVVVAQVEVSGWQEFRGQAVDRLSYSIAVGKEILLGLLSIWPLVLLSLWFYLRRKSVW